ncbi:MAG: leucine-rich repeat domain-containing protein [Clostridia bacterium]|nr:leucine-rich repeat domain-containing protein [Clostridia bacterium]
MCFDDVKINADTLVECRSSMTEYRVPKCVRVIGPDAFRNASVSRVVLPDKMERIHYAAFRGCTAKEIILPSNLRFIDSYAFAGCTASHLVLPEGLLVVSKNAFEASGLITLDLPYTVQIVDAEAFCGCSKLRKAIVRSRIVGRKAFWKCIHLDEVVLNSVISIGEIAFAECRSLKTAIFTEGLRTIGVGSFRNCQQMKNIQLPASVMEIGNKAFYGCYNIRITAPKHLDENIRMGCINNGDYLKEYPDDLSIGDVLDKGAKITFREEKQYV